MTGQKLGNYNQFVDDLVVFSLNVLVIDQDISTHSSVFPIVSQVDINSGSYVVNSSRSLSLNRVGTEYPILNLTASFITSTASALGPK